MNNNRVDYKEDVEEGFHNGINQDIALKAIIFSMIFYIVDSKLMAKLIENYAPIKLFGRDIVKAMIFALLFYFISTTIS